MNPLALLGAVPLWVYPMLGVALWGGCGMVQKHEAITKLQEQKLEIAQAKADQAAEARLKELALTEVNADVSKKLTASRQAVSRAAGDTDRRLRELAAAWAASAPSAAAGTTCRDDGAPVAAIIPGQAREDLVQLVQEAQGVSERLKACQDYVTRVRSTLK